MDTYTFEVHLANLISGLAIAPSTMIEGGQASSRPALIALLDDKKDALIAVLDAGIARFQSLQARFELRAAFQDDLIASTNHLIVATTNPGLKRL